MIDEKGFKRKREGLGYTQEVLSKLADVTIASISKIENGHSPRISMLNLKKLAKALKVKPAELLK